MEARFLGSEFPFVFLRIEFTFVEQRFAADERGCLPYVEADFKAELLHVHQFLEQRKPFLGFLDNGFQECAFACVPLFGHEQEDGQLLDRVKVEQLQVVHAQLVLFAEDMLHQRADAGEVALLRMVAYRLVKVEEFAGSTVKMLAQGEFTRNLLQFNYNGFRCYNPSTTSISTPLSIYCQLESGVDDAAADMVKIVGEEGAIRVVAESADVTVYTMTGQAVAAAAVDGEATIRLAAGFYIVRVGGTTVKVVVK